MADKRVKYSPEEKEMWFKARRAGESITKIAKDFSVPAGTISANCKEVGIKRGAIVSPAPKPQVEPKQEKGAGDSSGEFAELETAFMGVQSAAVAFVQKRHQELLTLNAELTSRLTKSEEKCEKLKEAVLEERNGSSAWKERLKSF